MQHEDIRVLQQELKDKGFFTNDETTTYYGDITLNAVKDFQASNNLNQDGVFGQTTYEALKSLNKSTADDVAINLEASPDVQIFESLGLTYTRDLTLDVTGTDDTAVSDLSFL